MSSVAAELAALRSCYAALHPELGAVVEDVDGATVLAVTAWPDHPWTSCVVLPGPGPADRAVARLRALGVTAPYVSAPAGVAPPPGFDRPLRLLWLAAPTGGAVPEGVERAHDPEEVVAVCRAGFGGWREDADRAWWSAQTQGQGWARFLVRAGGAAVATGAVHVGGRVAYLGGTTTVPAARGRGAHAALLAARLAWAAAQGATTAVAKVEPEGGSHRNLLRAGFGVVGATVQWRSR